MSIDEKYAWERQPTITVKVMKALLQPDPHDCDTHGFETLRFLAPKLKTWDEVAEKCRNVGRHLSLRILGATGDEA